MTELKRRLLASLSFAGAMSLLAATPAAAVNIVLAPDSSFAASPNGSAALLGFQKAANYWNQTLSNNATIRLDVHFDALNPGVLGGTFSNTFDTSAALTYARMAATGTSQLDVTALANLRPLSAAGGVGYRGPGTDPMTGLLTATTAGSQLDNNDTYNNLFLNANTAVDKALGIAVDADQTLFSFVNQASGTDFNIFADGDITFSSAFDFDFDPTDGIDVGAYDFVGVAIHEIGHALGFVSGTDDYDAAYIGVNTAAEIDGTSVLSNLDLFRYGAANPLPDGTHQLQLDPNREAYFSIDARLPFNFNAQLPFASSSFFATGQNFGDGGQASHWKDSLAIFDSNGCAIDARPVGIMDPTSSACTNGVITSNDLAAFDAIGYNLNDINIVTDRGYRFDTAQIFALPGLASLVPEPRAWALMLMGFGLTGLAIRRRKAGNLA